MDLNRRLKQMNKCHFMPYDANGLKSDQLCKLLNGNTFTKDVLPI